LSDPIKLNLGGGETRLPGFKTIDRKAGQEVYPLDGVEDNSVDEIYASHVLEHFSHRQVTTVLKHWVDKLRPGGKIRIGVPDFAKIAADYTAKRPGNTLGYVMGGHVDKDDCHGCIFDEAALTEMMINAGLTAISPWEHEIKDCSALDVSLNLQGVKAVGGMCKWGLRDVLGIESVPRFGPTMHMRSVVFAMQELHLRYTVGQGAYWHQVLTTMLEDGIEAHTEEHPVNWLLTFDYDTIFDSQSLLELYRCAHLRADIDAITCLQMKRHEDAALFCTAGREFISINELHRNLLEITSAHFGMTLIKVESLKRMPKPWFQATPDPNGSWRDGKIDADVHFWQKWRECGNTLYLAPRVHVGHLQEMVCWPRYVQANPETFELQTHYQSHGDFETNGSPRLMG